MSESGGKVEENDFGSANFAVGAEGRGWVVRRVEGDMQDCNGFSVLDNGSQVTLICSIVALCQVCQQREQDDEFHFNLYGQS